MNRPYIICLMATTVDGKILGGNWGKSPAVKKLLTKFEETHEKIGVGAWIVGRTTMEKDFTKGAKPVYKKTAGIDRSDFVADRNAKTFAIALDAHGKLGWEKPLMYGDHVITVLTEQVSDEYLAHLQEIGVSYIFAGTKTIDLTVAMEKLLQLFTIEKLMLEGGGLINGSFMNENLVDEFHQLLLPLVDGTKDTSTVFEVEQAGKKFDSRLLKLEDVKRLEDDVLWLTYRVVK